MFGIIITYPDGTTRSDVVAFMHQEHADDYARRLEAANPGIHARAVDFIESLLAA